MSFSLSVVLPVHNEEAILERNIDAAVDQSVDRLVSKLVGRAQLPTDTRRFKLMPPS